MGVSAYSAGKELPSDAEDVVFPGRGCLAAGGAAQRAILAALAVGGRGAVQQVVHRLAGKRSSRGAQQAGGGGIGKADLAMTVHAADAVGNRVQQNLLLAVEFFGAAALLRAGQHLSERGGRRLNGGHGFAVFAQTEVAVELEHRQHAVADAHRNRPAGDHLLAQGGLDAGTGGSGVQVGDPDRAAVFPCASRQLCAARPGSAPCSPG